MRIYASARRMVKSVAPVQRPNSGIDLAWLLETWRLKVARMTQATASRAMSGAGSITSAAISQWESGLRDVDDLWLSRLDTCYKAGGALYDVARAIDSPSGLNARLEWFHNFVGGSGPVWAWLRPQSEATHLAATLYWGPLRLRLQRRRCGRDGVMVVAPASIPNPPARVELDKPGWVDFGRGRIPRVLGIPRAYMA